MIDEKFYEYEIPKEYKKKLNKGFLSIFMNSLVKMWDEESIDNVIAYERGTNGWYEAFIKACFESGNSDMSSYYSRLEWFDTDRFDEELAEIIYDVGLARRI